MCFHPPVCAFFLFLFFYFNWILAFPSPFSDAKTPKGAQQQGGRNILYAPTHYRSAADISSGWNDMTFRTKQTTRSGRLTNCFSVLSPPRASDVWQMPDYQCCMKCTYFPSPEAWEETRSQRDLTIFTFFISQPWMLPRCLILSCSPFVRGGCWFFKMKDTCLAAFKESQNSESHLCCSAVLSPFYIQYWGDDQKDQSWGRS